MRVTWESKLITGGNVHTYYLGKADAPAANNNSLGHVKEGLNTFVAFYDFNADGMYTPGEPFGYIRDVDIGWNFAKASIELTDTSIVSMRYNIVGSGGEGGGNGASGISTDRESMWESTSTGVYTLSNEVYGSEGIYLEGTERRRNTGIL